MRKNTKNELERAVFQKLGSERLFRAFTELVSTRENSFRLETRLEILDKSSECRALLVTTQVQEKNIKTIETFVVNEIIFSNTNLEMSLAIRHYFGYNFKTSQL